MAKCDFGRKVFFLCPSFSMENILIPKLIENEYEVYIIKSHLFAKYILSKYPTSICLVNIDDDLSHNEWFNFISSCEKDETLYSISFGVLSAHIMNKTLHAHFIGNLKLEADFIPISQNLTDVENNICNILDKVDAKGRRQYVRVNCDKEKSTLVLIQDNDKSYKLQILDISVAGAACICSLEEKDFFVVNSIFRNSYAELGGKTFSVDIVIYAVITTENFCKLVLLFLPPVNHNVKQIIHSYISKTFSEEIAELELECPPDEQDYSV